MTGGDVNGKSSDPADIERRGGSIINYENNGEINLYYCEVSGNKAKGGGIWTKGASSINGGIINIYNSIIKNNEATDSFGGMHLYHVVAKFEDTIIDNNKATYDGAGVYIFKGSTTIQNTVISNNNGGRDGGGLYIQSYLELFIRQSTFTNNTATNHGDEIFTTSDATITVVNTVVDTNGIHDASTPTWQTCANSPCSVAPFTAACSAAMQVI